MPRWPRWRCWPNGSKGGGLFARPPYTREKPAEEVQRLDEHWLQLLMEYIAVCQELSAISQEGAADIVAALSFP